MSVIIAGPCAIESVDQFVGFADVLVRLFERFPSLQLVYKGSFDKANRTLSGSPRGVGLVEAEVAWDMIRRNHPNLPLTTDVHETWQCQPVSNYCAVLQIPAFLGRQTSLLEAAAATGVTVNLKKPPWETVEFYGDACTKLTKASDVWFTHRGTGVKGSLKVDLNELIDIYAQLPEHAQFVDVTHTNQGERWRSVVMARAIKALGIKNFFAETHPDPKSAVCDSKHQLSVTALERLLETVAGACGA